jgi:hypothetical protein
MLIAGRRHRFPALRAVLSVVLATALVLLAPQPGSASIPRRDFPRASQVKASMQGQGTWTRSLGDLNAAPVGASPAECRSNLPFAKAVESRSAWYDGAVARTRQYSGAAQVSVYRFGSRASAKRAIAKLARFLRACPTSQEWWCEGCDGFATLYRTPAARHEVGAQSVAWNERAEGMGIANGRAIAARTGARIVVTTVSHRTDPANMTTPPPPSWKRVVSVAATAVARATPSSR